ncbi:L-lactate dehydrogenase [Porcipelethomonas sp.]|uniref:L-lactate dehydrogenase n=1 Tax=Porcipelethomonas sp. TaxID=2981675 RepID=UPI003EF934E7
MNKQKCAVIGCGAVGATIAFALTQHSLFSELVLIDSNTAKAQGEAMDLSHGLPFTHPMKVYAGDYKDISDCFLIIITAGTAQKPNETRLDMVHKNVEIFKNIIPNITKYNNEAIILVVSNPVDILTYCTIKLSGFPTNRVLGSGTVLDTARLKYLLSEHLCVDSRSIHAFIIGEHGDSELAVWSSANVSGIDLEDFHGLCASCRDVSFKDVYEDVRDSAYEVIERKGATYYGIAMAVMRIVLSIIRDEHSVLPVSCFVDGHYGLEDLCIGVPAIVGSSGIEKVLDIPLSNEENDKLAASVKTLKGVISKLKI